MRNKNTFKQAMMLAVLLPFLAFSVVLANYGADEEEEVESRAGLRTTEEREEMRSQLKDARQAVQSERKEMMQERMGMRRAARAVIIKNVMENQIARATKALNRLSLILDKIEAKSADMPASADLTQVNDLISKAKAQEAALTSAIDKAQDEFEDLGKTKVETVSEDESSTTSEPVQEAKQVVKTFMVTMKDIKKKVIELHKTLHDTVKAMRAAAKAVDTDDSEEEEKGEEETESTTSETNN